MGFQWKLTFSKTSRGFSINSQGTQPVFLPPTKARMAPPGAGAFSENCGARCALRSEIHEADAKILAHPPNGLNAIKATGVTKVVL